MVTLDSETLKLQIKPYLAKVFSLMLPYNKKLKQLSQELRSKMTDAEIALWEKLRRKQLHGRQFYRQKPILDYIVDFYCPSARLVIELDGGQHYKEDGAANDAIRDEHLEKQGLFVLRFTNLDVRKNLDGIVGAIVQNLKKC